MILRMAKISKFRTLYNDEAANKLLDEGWEAVSADAYHGKTTFILGLDSENKEMREFIKEFQEAEREA